MMTYFGAVRFNDGKIMYFHHKSLGAKHPNGGWRNYNLYETDQDLVDEWLKQSECVEMCICGRDEPVEVMSIGSGTWYQRACRHCRIVMPLKEILVIAGSYMEPTWSPWRLKFSNKKRRV